MASASLFKMKIVREIDLCAIEKVKEAEGLSGRRVLTGLGATELYSFLLKDLQPILKL